MKYLWKFIVLIFFCSALLAAQEGDKPQPDSAVIPETKITEPGRTPDSPAETNSLTVGEGAETPNKPVTPPETRNAEPKKPEVIPNVPKDPAISTPQRGNAAQVKPVTIPEQETPPAPPEENAPPAGEPEALEQEIMGFAGRLGISLGIVAGQALLVWLLWLFFKKISLKIVTTGREKIKPLTIKKLSLLSSRQIIDVILFLLRILKYLITAIQFFITLPIVFSFFPSTRNLAHTLFGYILNPVKNIAIGAVKYIPNLFTIVIIILVTRYVLKALKFFAVQISRGRLVITGFYPDWADPTYKILQVLLWAFTVAIVYPYLPGSDSKIFQGVSVFVGIIFSLGSSSAIGNLVAGLVITYMRPFKIGDRVKIKESTGFVVEKNLMVVRLKTHKNEYVTFPNLIILSSNITNYHTSSIEDEEGLILNTEITFGYDTPWQTVHEILINAALATEHVQKKPKPFVLQTALDDYYCRYQINCYTKEVNKVPSIYARLYENIQNGFRAASIDMTAPHYRINVVK